MNQKLRDDLWNQYHHLLVVAEQTVEKLGHERAWRFVHLANDWIDLQCNGLVDAYPQDELLGSLIYADFTGLFKEIRCLQLLLFAGYYPILYRNLRYIWELIFRAHHADTYSDRFPDDPDQPGPIVDEKIDWLGQREKQLNWRTVIEPAFRTLLPKGEHGEIESRYRPLWETLCSCIHPSSCLRYRMIEDSELFIKDAFDEAWADEAIQVASEVFDLCWLVVLKRFPNCLPLLTGDQLFHFCPKSRAMVVTR